MELFDEPGNRQYDNLNDDEDEESDDDDQPNPPNMQNNPTAENIRTTLRRYFCGPGQVNFQRARR